jgi:NADPH-dependent glutamate synthase beta subunit-like oxidoreductase/NAD-dependent dihydropyrimidine dehydrogenase PreA subunit
LLFAGFPATVSFSSCFGDQNLGVRFLLRRLSRMELTSRVSGADARSWWFGRDAQNFRYWETNFPCRAACPVHTNAGGYVALIAQGRYREAYLLARGPNPFASICGRVCAHPCEAACRRGGIDQPIAIRALKRVVTERFGVESAATHAEVLAAVERPRPPAPDAGRVAVVGAGPAGLSCAHDLALMGHRVTVFDAAPVAGGMMRLGIPEYRLPRDLIAREIGFIESLGVDLRLGVEIGRDVPFAELRSKFDAVFLAPGCRRGKALKLPGSDLPGVITAVDFLVSVNLGIPLEIGQTVVVVGGGNVAFDVARSARRFGGTSLPDEEHHNLAADAAVAASRILRRQVTLVSLEARHEMPADPEEIEEGSHEGIRVLHRRGPKAVLGNGQVRALRTVAVSRVFDERGRFVPQFVDGADEDIPCDTVILAVGQVADLSFLGDGHGLETTPQQTIVVDGDTLATSVPGVFAGGDVAFGPRIVIAAVADGRRAARSIDTFLTGRHDGPVEYRIRVFPTFGYEHPFARGDFEKRSRHRVPVLPIERRQAREEVELLLSLEDARAEGSRCLHCWVNTVFDSSAVQGSECIQCGGCVDVCPEQCINLVSLTHVAAASDAVALLPNTAPLELLDDAQGAALLKDETACIRCGLCARRCPAGVITMQAFHRESEAHVMRLADAVL